MALSPLERQVWTEARKLFNNPNLRLKDLLEWSTSEVLVKKNLRETEVMGGLLIPPSMSAELCAGLAIYVAIDRVHDKRNQNQGTDDG